MKFLKFLLILVVIGVIAALGCVIFSNKILFHMTKTDNTEFQNLRFSIKDREILFDNFVLGGEKLGKGKAKISLKGSGIFGAVPKVELSAMELQEVDLQAVYNAPDSRVDAFLEKINIPIENEKFRKTTESYIKEAMSKIESLNRNIDDFSQNVREKVNLTNKMKQDYNGLVDLKSKAQKLTELNKELSFLTKDINTQKEKIGKTVYEVEIERGTVLENISEELVKLERLISLNDIQNINSYIFLDKGKEISASLNKSLKAVKLMKKMENISEISISDVSINNGEMKFKALGKENKNSSGEVQINNGTKAEIKETEKGHEVTYNQDTLEIRTLFGEELISVIEYSKNDLIEGKLLKLVSELIFENNNVRNINKTDLSEEDRKQLSEKIENMKSSRYTEIMTQYEDETYGRCDKRYL
ncbi:MAG: hypothetical protein Q4D53_03170 [Leptotrichiaceae bacterium]|nr:hypothetical protein [Leptotrichiaceae bacterium]